MEIAGLVIGVASTVGILGQIFNGCIKAYSIFTAASNLGRDSDRLVCKIRIEEMRLKVWGREWGVMEGKLEEHLLMRSGAQHEGLKTLAEMILTQLYQTVMVSFCCVLQFCKLMIVGPEQTARQVWSKGRITG